MALIVIRSNGTGCVPHPYDEFISRFRPIFLLKEIAIKVRPIFLLKELAQVIIRSQGVELLS